MAGASRNRSRGHVFLRQGVRHGYEDMSPRLRSGLMIAVAAAMAAGCQASKSSTPLAPSVAGPIAGVKISTPNLLEPGQDWQIRPRDQPVRLMIQNADTSGGGTLHYTVEGAGDAGVAVVL